MASRSIVARSVAVLAAASFLVAPGPAAFAAAPSPNARTGMGMTYDLDTRSVVLFGGINRFGYVSDTWEWDGSAWMQDSQVGLPTPRNGAGFAYDAPRKRLVMFGGQFCSEFGCQSLGDTWLWDGTRWRRQHPANSPPPLPSPAMEYDPVHQQIVLFGGATLNQTWTWDGTNWLQRFPGVSPPAKDSEMAFDVARRRLVLFNSDGQTWTWNGTTWTHQNPATSPSPRSATMMAYDGVSRKVLLFGGLSPTNADLGDTWTWNGTTWHQESPATSPPPRGDGGFSYDILHHQIVLFGGITDCTPICSLLGDTWTWDGSTWTEHDL